MSIKHEENPDQSFYDKNGVKIKIGDKIKTNIDDQFRDCVVYEEEEKLGLYFKYGDFFIKLDNMLVRFFETVEIIER